MKYLFTGFFFIAGIILFLYIFFALVIFNAVDDEMTESNELIGESLVLKNDTLMIIDQSFINNTYTLENGSEISKELGEKLLIKN